MPFLQMVSRFDVSGADVNESLVSWFEAKLDRVTSGINAPETPLAYGASSFVFIYSLSIFTHLSQKAAVAWIEESARVTADNEIVLLTTHGFPALGTICESEVYQTMFRLRSNESRDLRRRLAKERFIHLRYGADVIALAYAGLNDVNSFTHQVNYPGILDRQAIFRIGGVSARRHERVAGCGSFAVQATEGRWVASGSNPKAKKAVFGNAYKSATSFGCEKSRHGEAFNGKDHRRFDQAVQHTHLVHAHVRVAVVAFGRR